MKAPKQQAPSQVDLSKLQTLKWAQVGTMETDKMWWHIALLDEGGSPIAA